MGLHTYKPGEHTESLERLPELTKPLLEFDLPAEIRQLQQQESWQRGTGRSSKALVKYPDFRIVLVAMQAGSLMKEHRAEGRISIQTLQGRVRFTMPEKEVEVAAGQLLVLDHGIPHDVKALQESAFLLTIAWPECA